MDNDNIKKSGDKLSSAFMTGILINIVFVAVEAVYGYLANSMALVADAGHNLSDVLALGLSWVAVVLSMRKPTRRFTYGFRRSTILAALLNTILLLVAVAIILWETISRIGRTEEINSKDVMIIAGIGILVNGFTAWLFMKDNKRDLNVRSAFLHFVADAIVSLGVVVAGFVMAVTGITWIDSVTSIIISGVILYSAYHLLIDSVNLSLDAVPENINIEEVREFLGSVPGVNGVHDLHIWALGTTTAALTVHISTGQQTDNVFINDIRNELHRKFRIEHTTIQIEYGNNADCIEKICN